MDFFSHEYDKIAERHNTISNGALEVKTNVMRAERKRERER